MFKVIVIGCPGSGKSTFARKLRDEMHLPLYYLDMIWHKPDKTNISKQDFLNSIQEITCKEKWIIDGNYLHTLEMRLKECDTVFLMNYPLDVCLSGVSSRVGQEREDMPWIETEFDEEFKQWILNFSKEQMPQIYGLLKKYQNNRDIIIFKSREESEQYLKELSVYRK